MFGNGWPPPWTSCRKYCHRHQPLSIPEQCRDEYDARRMALYLDSLKLPGWCLSEWIVESATQTLTKHYESSITFPILCYVQSTRCPDPLGLLDWVLFHVLAADGADPLSSVFEHGLGMRSLSSSALFMASKRGPEAGVVAHFGGPECLLIGWGFQARVLHACVHSIYLPSTTCFKSSLTSNRN